MPMNRLTLTMASIALGGLCLGSSAMAQAPSGGGASPPSSTSPSTPAQSPGSPSGATTQSPNPSSFMTEMRSGMWRATKLDGVDVYNNNNEKVGDISDLLLDSSGKVSAVVIGVGGFLGMGERYVAVPFEQVRWSNEPVRSARSGSTSTTSPSGSSNSSGAPSATSDRGDVTGSVRSGSGSSGGGDVATRGYPDHALLNMTKEQLRSAPEFKYSSSSGSTR